MVKNKETFEAAVRNIAEIKDCYRAGLSALDKKHRPRIRAKETRSIEGSLYLDECLKEVYPVAGRWDYAVAYKSRVYFTEVHSGFTSDVKKVIKKLEWLKSWLRKKAPGIDQRKAASPFVWIVENGVHIKGSSHARTLAMSGIRIESVLNLDYDQN